MNESALNLFMALIYEKSLLKNNIFAHRKHNKEVEKFKKEIESGSPSFDVLWDLSDFIKIAETVFFYDNSLSNNEICLFSSRNYQKDTNGFRITDPVVGITVKLFEKSKSVMLEVDRHKGEKLKTIIHFKNNEWESDPTIYDEMLLEQVIKEINRRALMLFDFCYKLR